MDMLHKRLIFPRIQHFSISAAGMSRSEKEGSSLETELLPERHPRLRIVAIFLSILSAIVYFATSEGAANGIHSRALVNPLCPDKIFDQFIAGASLYTMSVPGATKLAARRA
jgi:hypothetical protein